LTKSRRTKTIGLQVSMNNDYLLKEELELFYKMKPIEEAKIQRGDTMTDEEKEES